MEKEVILDVRHLKKYYPIKSGLLQKVTGHVKAVDDISFALRRGTTMGLVGESGCGKTTAGRTILRLITPTAGEVRFHGQDIFTLDKRQMRLLRPKLQLIFQDPYSALSPRMTVGDIILEGVKEHRIVPKDRYDRYLEERMEECGISPSYKDRYPHEFSGGQRQRINIARALAMKPEIVVADEPVLALDVSIQAQIVNLLKELQREHGLSYLFISHDLSVVEHICDEVGVMYLGNIVELSSTEDLFANPLHPYTECLLSAVPNMDPRKKMKRIILEGDMPSPADPPSGCKFHTRCPYATELCVKEEPKWEEKAPGHFAACHYR